MIIKAAPDVSTGARAPDRGPSPRMGTEHGGRRLLLPEPPRPSSPRPEQRPAPPQVESGAELRGVREPRGGGAVRWRQRHEEGNERHRERQTLGVGCRERHTNNEGGRRRQERKTDGKKGHREKGESQERGQGCRVTDEVAETETQRESPRERRRGDAAEITADGPRGGQERPSPRGDGAWPQEAWTEEGTWDRDAETLKAVSSPAGLRGGHVWLPSHSAALAYRTFYLLAPRSRVVCPAHRPSPHGKGQPSNSKLMARGGGRVGGHRPSGHVVGGADPALACGQLTTLWLGAQALQTARSGPAAAPRRLIGAQCPDNQTAHWPACLGGRPTLASAPLPASSLCASRMGCPFVV